MKTKVDFITDLLSNKKLHTSQKERMFALVANDLKGDEEEVNKIWEEINKLKYKGFKVEDSSIDSNNTTSVINIEDLPLSDNEDVEDLIDENFVASEKEDNSLILLSSDDFKIPQVKKHSPKTMVKLLYLFSYDESFKWFTHNPDNSIDKINYTQKLNDFDKNLKAFYLTWDLNFHTYFFIRNFFINNSKKKSEYNKFKIDYPIQYSTVLSFANEEIKKRIESGISPFDIVINDEYFSKTIQLFKNSIEFRLDYKEYKFESVFRNFVVNNLSIDLIDKYGDNFNGIAKSLTAYLDVNNFYRGLKVVLGWINDYKSLSNQIIIDLLSEDDYYNLIIFHKNSRFLTSPYSSKFNGNSGDLEKLRKYWFSIVDWNIEADCIYDGKTEAYNFICLKENTELTDNKLTSNIIEKLDSNVGGVKHTIKIYKTKNL